MKKKSTRMTLNALELPVHLGWPKSERDTKQQVMLDIHLHFSEQPKGCVTDRLEDTFCYAALTEYLHDQIKNRSFHLLEHFTAEVHQIIQSFLPSSVMIEVCVTKKPDVPGLHGGVSFHYGDRHA
ncbi:MAG: dihydroneopterin aldolase [Gammaproteobacteria bacterium]|nr:dihydroneopterin aldolase [Gammaproteobacteria bacterium]